MRIALIAHHVAPIAPPFVGGVESHTWGLAGWLAARGHDVTLFGMDGSAVPGVRCRPLALDASTISPAARRDVSALPGPFLAAHHAYLQLMLELADDCPFDAVHVNTLHYLPVAMASLLPVRPVLTLHCPPTPWLESALAAASSRGDRAIEIAAVSPALAEAWADVVPDPQIVPNGIDLAAWSPGDGGAPCVWAGRIVPEKAPHLAIDAARAAGHAIDLAGPVIDRAYWSDFVEPRLGPDVRYLGHLDHEALGALVRSSKVSIQSPVWDEPFGLIAAESIASGTPVAAFPRGGLPGVVGRLGGAIAGGLDSDSLAEAIDRAAGMNRAAVRAHAERELGLDAMGRRYEAIYRRIAAESTPRPVSARGDRGLTGALAGDAPLAA